MEQKIKILLKIGILTFGISLLMTSCSKENVTEIELSEIQQLQNNFTLDNFDDVFVKNNLEIDWENFKTNINSENHLISYEFNTNYKVKSSIDDYVKYTLLASKNEINDWSFELIKFSTNKLDINKNFSCFITNNLTGSVYHYNLNGDNTLIKIYSKGKLIEEISIKNYDNVSTLAKAPIYNGHCYGCWILVRTEHYTDWYTNSAGGSSLYYSHSTYNGSTTEWVWLSENDSYNGIPYDSENDSFHNHYDNPHGPSGATNNHPEEVIINPSFTSIDKINCTYNQLLKNTTIKELLDTFFGNDADYDLVFEVETVDCNGSNVAGCTSSNLENDQSITITIDLNYINSNQTPTLLLAQTIIHEAIHANMYLAVYNYSNGNATNLPDIDDFPAIYEQYRLINNWQHEFMATQYIDLISQTLQQIHPLLNDQQYINSLSNFDFSLEQFYTCLAYIGLNGTVGQTNFLSDPINFDNYNSSYYDVTVNSTKTPNCD